MGKNTFKLILLITVFLFLYIVPLGIRPLAVPDETRYGEIPREMLASGDWTVPRINGILYFEKPVLGYWLNALSMKLFGENAFAIRLPSAVSVGLSGLLLFLLVRMCLADPAVAYSICLVFMVSFAVFGIGVFCVLDSVFSFFVTATLVTFYGGYVQVHPFKKRMLLGLCGAAAGLGFLTKGLLGLVLPGIIILPFLLWERRLRDLWHLSWLPATMALLVILPWSIQIYLREPGFWHYFFWTEHISRFFAPNGGQHPYPVWFYVPILLGGLLPWTFLCPLVLNHRILKQVYIDRSIIRYALCWFGLPFIFFSLSHGKLGTYILPCFPPLAILISVSLHTYLKSGHTKGFTIVGGLVTGIMVLLFFDLMLGQLYGPTPLYESPAVWKAFLVGTGLIVWALLSYISIQQRHGEAKLLCFAFAPVLLMFSVHFAVPDIIAQKKMPEIFLSTLPRIPPESILVSDNHNAGAVCWFYDRNDVYLLGGTGEYQNGLLYEGTQNRALDTERFYNLVAQYADTKGVVVFMETKRYNEFKGRLSNPACLQTNGYYVFADYSK